MIDFHFLQRDLKPYLNLFMNRHFQSELLKNDATSELLKNVAVNTHASKKFTPHNSSWFCRTKGVNY